MAIFSSGVPITSLGYHVLFQPKFIADPAAFSPYGDPRGLLRTGMVPGRSLSYRIYNETIHSYVSAMQQIAAQAGAVLGILGGGVGAGAFTTFPEVCFNQSVTSTAVMVFEGHDVIDLPTEGLKYADGALKVPHKVFRPLFAGAGKFIGPKDDIAKRCIQEFANPSPENMVRGVAKSDSLPPEIKNNFFSLWSKRGVDVLSDGIIVEGSPSYVSYVACDKPLWRDVITFRVRSQATGIAGGQLGFLILDATISYLTAEVMRFVLVNTAQAGQPDKFVWRMSESYGVKTKGTVEKNPSAAYANASDDEKTIDILAQSYNHLIYNLNDASDDLTKEEFGTPTKNAVYPLFAKAKASSASPLYDKNFSYSMVNMKPGYGSTGNLATPYAIRVGPPGQSVFQDNPPPADPKQFRNTYPQYYYTSPSFLVNLSANARLGWEYSDRAHDTVQLGKTIEGSSGVSALYDFCIYAAEVLDTYSSSAGQIPVERAFDDTTWTQTQRQLPEDEDPNGLKQFLLGEYPWRSAGRTVLVPLQKKIEGATISPASVTIPAKSLVTSIMVTVGSGSDTPGIIKLYSGAPTGAPIFEVSIKGNFGGDLLVGIPALRFGSYKATGGMTIKELYGADSGEVMLAAMPGDTSSSDPSEFQLANLGEQKFPIPATAVVADSDCTSGWLIVAYENESHIDVGCRSQYAQSFGIVRDVTLRICDQVPFSKSSIPPSSMPFVIVNPKSRIVHLFYAYKQKLLVKHMPIEAFQSEPLSGTSLRYSVESEKKIAQRMHRLGACMVYDGTSSGTKSGIDTDLAAKAIKVVEGNDPNGTIAKDTVNPLSAYSAFLDREGWPYAFVQAQDKFIIRRSNDSGSSWRDAIPRDMSLVPPPKSDLNELANKRTPLFPYCLYDGSNKTVNVFFFYESSLLYLKLPTEILRMNPDNQADLQKIRDQFSKFKPQVLVGNLSQNMVDRGIVANPTVDPKLRENPPTDMSADKDTTPAPSLSPHRVGGVVTIRGYYRVWFKDANLVLRSLVSMDCGTSWYTDWQLLAKNGK